MCTLELTQCVDAVCLSATNLANLYASLKRCTSLQSFEIQCNVARHPDYVTRGTPFVFLDMLAEMLSESPSSSTPGSCPGLLRLRPRVWLPERDTLKVAWLQTPVPIPDGWAEACEQLARALEDRSRHSNSLLRRLEVTVRMEQWTDEIYMSAAHWEMVVAQEPVLPSYFERAAAAGVQLRVVIV
ncbi:hypothetical protein GSI_13339 [Ganoderma sinense ZZ0214-1]|uniref:Uncharacterized protein n=1 Tax=Ganoderma sinense ZZ0214-1 TaxID=1077348 RepID=A0A2G8RVC2_9APHY|nr:hypothetical protein GSI_13339 [Ganoderma sinense ZZ0214-1]